MKNLLERLNALVDWGANLILINMVTVITLQITMRYIFDRPLQWSEELARYSYAWFCLFGIALVTKERTHLSVSFIFDRFPLKVRQVIHIASMSLMLIFFLAGSWGTMELPGVQGNIRAYSLGIPFYVLHLSILPGFLVSALYTVYHFYRDLRPGKKGET